MSGAVLENGLKLKKANLRGVESDGMMMSEQELGYEEKSPGIVVLPPDWDGRQRRCRSTCRSARRSSSSS